MNALKFIEKLKLSNTGEFETNAVFKYKCRVVAAASRALEW